MPGRDPGQGWSWFEPLGQPVLPSPDVCRAFHACFGNPHGQTVLTHLRRMFLDRRVPHTASDAELRHTEGQRSAIAYIAALVERAREPREDNF